MKRAINLTLTLLILSVFYSCQKEISLESHLPSGPASSGTAVFTLSGSGASCINANVAGSYVQGTKLGSSNTVELEVNVTTIGTWTMNTSAAGGFYFAGTGTFANTGVQLITLVGSGTPSASGDQTFTVTAGGANCTFVVNVTPSGTTPPATSGDHFPLTANSWWSYEDISSPGDTLKIVNVATSSFGGNSYRLFQWQADGTPVDTSYFRKAGNDYFEYTYVDFYSLVTFDVEQKGDILFLKEGLKSNDTWNSAEYQGAFQNQPLKLRYAFTCSNANATVSVGGKSFSNVYQIIMKPQISLMGSPYVDDGLVWTIYFAQGIGLIYQKAEVGGQVAYELPIRYWKVF